MAEIVHKYVEEPASSDPIIIELEPGTPDVSPFQVV